MTFKAEALEGRHGKGCAVERSLRDRTPFATYVPQRGDIVWLDFSPPVGHEQSGHRPAFVLSPISYNRRTGLLLGCPITTKVKGYPSEVALPAGLPIKGVILANHVKTVDWQVRHACFATATSPRLLEQVIARLLTLVDPWEAFAAKRESRTP